MRDFWRFGWAALLLAIGGSARGFTFADGTTIGCRARGQLIEENLVEPGPATMAFTAKTVPVGATYQIIWNEAKLKALPPDVHDYLFFHECAHAKVPTTDEIMANCVGLKDMREAGRAGPAVEARMTAFYGANSSYWARTVKCANGEPY